VKKELVSMKIYLEIIDEPVKGKCVITGKKVTFEEGYGFFAEGKVSRPVIEEEACKQGFTMKKQTLKRLASLIDQGKKFEEVQKSAHEEFENL
jgi:hypothetical protein